MSILFINFEFLCKAVYNGRIGAIAIISIFCGFSAKYSYRLLYVFKFLINILILSPVLSSLYGRIQILLSTSLIISFVFSSISIGLKENSSFNAKTTDISVILNLYNQ